MAAPPPADVQADTQPEVPITTKPIHSLIIDTGPLIKNDPPVDTLRARAEQLYTLPSVIPEIRDAATRARVETTLLPFVTLRSPKPDSVKLIQSFARKTGDLEVLSRPDIEVLALAYELECERNNGDWRLRSTPGQKTLNGKMPKPEGQPEEARDDTETAHSDEAISIEPEAGEGAQDTTVTTEAEPTREEGDAASLDNGIQQLHLEAPGPGKDAVADPETTALEAHNIAHESTPAADTAGIPPASGEKADETTAAQQEASDDDEEGWITPSNLKKHQARDSSTTSTPSKQPTTLQAAVLTSDFAMQNVALRMNLNLVSPQLSRISTLRTWILRCHACFQVTKQMDRRFCPSCGQATLLRAACTVNDRTGAVTVHLKKNFQWNNRGNVYSVPKPVHGSANGRQPTTGKGKSAGGHGGWGRDLIFAEDQKEFTRASDEQRRQQKKDDLMDEDYLPGILTGNRSGGGGRIKVGAGRNVNSRRKR